jgi:hypothetical protein
MREKQVEKTQVSIRISDELLGQIDRMAKLERRNRSNMIEYILREALKQRGKK